MIGVKVKRNGNMYEIDFPSYSAMLKYLFQHRPSQFCLMYDGEKTTGSRPVSSYIVSQDEDKDDQD